VSWDLHLQERIIESGAAAVKGDVTCAVGVDNTVDDPLDSAYNARYFRATMSDVRPFDTVQELA